MLTGVALDRAGTGWATERRAQSVTMDEVKDLRGVVRIWTRLTHQPSDDLRPCATFPGPEGNVFSRRHDV